MLGRGYRRIAYIIGPSYLPTSTPTPACPQLTTVRQPMDAFGVSLATLVLDQIEDRPFHRTVVLADVDADASVPAAAHRGRSQIGAQRTVLNNVCAHFSTPEAHMEYALITAMSPFAMM